MRLQSLRLLWLVAALLAAVPAHAQTSAERDYAAAREAFDQQNAAYWRAVADKRRVRNAKRRDGAAILLDDYVLAHPPVYDGPPRPPGVTGPGPGEIERPPIPTVGDFVRHAAEQFGFVPQRPANELTFKRAYAQAAMAAGLTREQVVRIYAFETGGDGTYDLQSGLTNPPRSGARPISPAIGYNQLLSTVTVGLLSEYGDRYVAILNAKAETLLGDARAAMHRKTAALRRMIATARSVPHNWNEHDRLAKTTPGGFGIHAAVLDRDLGPLLQVQKLVNSVQFARSKGVGRPLTGAELELMNFTGDGNGLDMVLMPDALRERVPTANFFQQLGYERNPIARRSGTVAGLIAAIDQRMDRAMQMPGARDMAAAF